METLRAFYDFSGIALCGSEITCIELRRDLATVNAGHGCYNYLFVMPIPQGAAEIDFSHPKLLNMEWAKQKHVGTGEEVLLPLLSGAVGDRAYSMMSSLINEATASNSLVFNAGTDTLRWFYADELLYRLLLNKPLVKYTRAPPTDLYECNNHFCIDCFVFYVRSLYFLFKVRHVIR